MASVPQTVGQKARRANIILAGVGLGILLILGLLWLGPGRGSGPVLVTLGAIDPVVYWILLMVVTTALVGGIGRATTQRWLGALIDSSTNSMSLSRLQVALWTILVLSAYLMLAMPRVFGVLTAIEKMDPSDPLLAQCRQGKAAGFVPSIESCGGGALQITFPPQLVLAMGISLASFAGSHLIQNVKSSQDLDLEGKNSKLAAAKKKLYEAQTAFEAQKARSSKINADLNRAQDAVAAANLKTSPAGADPERLKTELNTAFEAQKARSSKINADYDRAVDAAAAADANVNTPPAGADLERLKTEQSHAKLVLDQTQIIYNRSIADLSQAQTTLKEAQQEWDTAKKDALNAKRALDQTQIIFNRADADLKEARTTLNDAQQEWDTAKKDALAAQSEAAGVLHKNENIKQASWSDIFRGNLVTDYTHVDYGKVQMFFFTVVIVLAYGAAAAALLRSGPAMMNPLGIGFPPFSDSLNGLLAISHGAYLTTKATAQV